MGKTSATIHLLVEDPIFRAEFEKLVGKAANIDQCWEWLGTLDHYGYGQYSHSSYPYKAHRLSYLIHKEADDNFDDLLVLHSCDNPICVNPNHLSLGTHAENLAQASGRNRFPNRQGDSHPVSKLTKEKVLEIQTRYAEGNTSQRQLAKEYSITPQWVSSLINNPDTWANMPKVAYDKKDMKAKMGENSVHAIVTEELVKQVRERFSEGDINYADLGRLFNIKVHHAHAIATRRIWKHI